MELSMNSFTDKLTNFKIKPREDITQIQLSNKSVLFIAPGNMPYLGFKEIRYNKEDDLIEIILE